MIALLAGRAWGWVVGIGAALAAGVWLVLAARQSGRDVERAAQAARDVEAANARAAADAGAAGVADPVAELFRRWKR